MPGCAIFDVPTQGPVGSSVKVGVGPTTVQCDGGAELGRPAASHAIVAETRDAARASAPRKDAYDAGHVPSNLSLATPQDVPVP